MSDQDITNVAGALADMARALGSTLPTGAQNQVPEAAIVHSQEELGRRAKALHRARRRRNAIFGEQADIFGEPGWDILLELFIAHADGRQIDTSTVQIAADASMSTGLRHILALQDRGLVRRWGDPRDRRRSMVELTAEGIDLMTRCLRQG